MEHHISWIGSGKFKHYSDIIIIKIIISLFTAVICMTPNCWRWQGNFAERYSFKTARSLSDVTKSVTNSWRTSHSHSADSEWLAVTCTRTSFIYRKWQCHERKQSFYSKRARRTYPTLERGYVFLWRVTKPARKKSHYEVRVIAKTKSCSDNFQGNALSFWVVKVTLTCGQNDTISWNFFFKFCSQKSVTAADRVLYSKTVQCLE